MPTNWSSAPKNSGLMLKWGDGWIEVFPEDEFAEECQDRPRKIYMYRRGEKRKPVRIPVEYTLRVDGHYALLDYGGRFRAANASADRDIYIGETRIRFVDETRTAVESVEWRDVGRDKFEEYDVIPSWRPARELPPITPFKPPKKGDRRKRGVLEAVLRPNQLRFRSQLLGVYARRCAVTGFRVEAALEAAHLMPYRGPDYDHIQNGLLIRADLHRLLDLYLISINPATYGLAIAPSLRRFSEYAVLDGHKLNLPARKEYWPAVDALAHHWRGFKRARGLP